MGKILELPMDGQKIKAEYEELDIFKLHFDPQNPRVGSVLKRHSDEVSDEFIDKQLWNKNQTHQLFKDIEMAGGLLDPIIVYQGKVLEGNTRLCCYRHLYEEADQRNKQKWRHISCKVILEHLSPKQIHMMLCNFHIVRKNEWDTYEKGNYLTKMIEEDDLDYEYVSKITHLSVPDIRYHIKAFKIMVEEKDTNIKRYSHYLETCKNQKIQALKKTDPEIEKKIITAIKTNRFKDAKDVRKVPVICEDPRAKKRLFEYGEPADEVFIALKAQSPMAGSSLLNATKDLTKRLKKLTREEREGLTKKEYKEHIKELTEELTKLCKELDIKINKS